MKKYFKILLLILSPLILTGCQNKTENGGPTITINHEFGRTKVPVNAQRIVAISEGDFDTMLALGVKPLATSKMVFNFPTDDKVSPWVGQWIQNNDPNYVPELFEVNDFSYSSHAEYLNIIRSARFDSKDLSLLKPDLIIAPFSSMSRYQYKTLSKIAPTIPSLTRTSDTQTWQDDTRAIGMALSKTQEAEELIASTQELINNKLVNYPNLKGKTVAILDTISANSEVQTRFISIDLPNQPRYSFFQDLRLEIPENIKNELPNKNSFLEITQENVSMLNDVDIIIITGYAYEKDDQYKDTSDIGQIISQIPAVKRGSIIYSSEFDNLVENPTPLSIPYFIDNYMSLLNNAAMKVN